MKVEQTKITVAELADEYSDKGLDGVRGYGGKLDIRPPYQREFIYGEKERNEVIRTTAKGFPLNSMYWAAREDGDFEVIDGQQRSISLCQFMQNDFSVEGLFGVPQRRAFHNLDGDEQKAISEYPLTVYQCTGGDTERLEWFRVINIAGKALSDQELRNAVYSGSWVTSAKADFGHADCQAHRIFGKYLSGAVIRQEFLETAIDWISENKIEKYMAKHQNDADAGALWDYMESVMDWVQAVFPKYYKEMKGIDWGGLHRRFQNYSFDSAVLQKRVAELMADEEVQKKRGIYEYVLSGDESCLHLRAFSDAQKRTAYEKQGCKCAGCGGALPIEKMEGDHITPWSRGGKTTDDNCQMLCRPCNARKSDN